MILKKDLFLTFDLNFQEKLPPDFWKQLVFKAKWPNEQIGMGGTPVLHKKMTVNKAEVVVMWYLTNKSRLKQF